MRKDMRGVVEEDFFEALSLLGYTRIRQDGLEWRRLRFHLFIRKKGSDVALRIHEDVPSHLPPFHRARHEGEAVREEMRTIVEAYIRRRAAKK